MKVFIGFIDVAGLYFALTQLTHRNISQNHKFQAVGLGWAFADSVLHRLAPLWIGTRGLEFTWEYIFQGIEANANLVMTLSLAALGSLMWLRKNKPRTLVPIIYACALLLATMPSITSYLRRSLEWQTPKVVGFELFSSLVMAFISWQLFAACQRPTWWVNDSTAQFYLWWFDALEDASWVLTYVRRIRMILWVEPFGYNFFLVFDYRTFYLESSVVTCEL